METQVRTPQAIFMQPQRLIVPLFQRPYVWNNENQWEPLWSDVARVAERLLQRPHERHHPHFLGAVVLQQVARPTGQIQERIIIDGQQRLTTLQLLLDALHAELAAHAATAAALRLEALVRNPDPFCAQPEDRFKVWPTNRDRAAFNDVMAATPPVAHDALPSNGHRMVEAHRAFSRLARTWLEQDGADAVQRRANAVETAARELLQMVVIDLVAEENAQEIFETLNARGAQLTAADLIKNLVFQRLLDERANVDEVYEQYWKELETAFWEAEIGVGRVRYSRASVFLNHWLVARLGDEVVAREVFARFKSMAVDQPMRELVVDIHRASGAYRRFVLAAGEHRGPIDRVGLFAYRTSVLESEVIKPLVLYLLDEGQAPIPAPQLTRALDAIESWMVRRMLVRAVTKNYNQTVAELIRLLRGGERAVAGDSIERFLREQTSDSRYWPDDDEVRTQLRDCAVYYRLGRGRLRMVLEAVEDHLRGWRHDRSGLGGERVARGSFAIEHIMPRKWATHWPMTVSDDAAERARDDLIHTLGNLTLLTGKLNTKLSNGPWTLKREALQAHDVLILNRELLKQHTDAWTNETIRRRGGLLIDTILEVWPAPAGHRSPHRSGAQTQRAKVDLADLINGGALLPGAQLYPRRKKHAERAATLLADGAIEVDGRRFESPSAAASEITGKPTNGWWFFLTDRSSRKALKEVLHDYVTAMSADIDAESDDETDDEE